MSGLPERLDLVALRGKEMLFWNLIWSFTVWRLPYDFMLPYVTEGTSALTLPTLPKHRRNISQGKAHVESDPPWLEQFRFIRTRALCHDSKTQTEGPAHDFILQSATKSTTSSSASLFAPAPASASASPSASASNTSNNAA